MLIFFLVFITININPVSAASDEPCSPACSDKTDCDGDGYAAFPLCGGEDCNDADTTVTPIGPEICDGKVNICGDTLQPEEYDNDHDSFMPCNGDCNDNDLLINSNAAEICNDNLDNDCDSCTDCSDSDCAQEVCTGIPSNEITVCSSGCDHTTIQGAIDSAISGDTILVKDGTYPENINVYKDHLTIKSENGPEKTIVQAEDSILFTIPNEVRVSFMVGEGFGVPRTEFQIGEWIELNLEGEELRGGNHPAIANETTFIISDEVGNVIWNKSVGKVGGGWSSGPGGGWGAGVTWEPVDKFGKAVPTGNYRAGVIFTDPTFNFPEDFTGIMPFKIRNGVSVFVHSTQNLGNKSLAIATGDIDNDGDLDIIFRDVSNKVYRNNDNGIFTYDYDFGISGNGYAASLILGDLDGDSDLDVLSDGDIYMNDATGNFTFAERLSDPISNWDISQYVEISDIDNDSDLDIIMCIISSNSIEIHLNNGTGSFVKSQELSSPYPTGSDTEDIDNDGDLDLIVSNSEGYSNKVFKNNGSGHFTDTGQSLGNSYTYDVTLGDIDNDGDSDLIEGNINAQNKVYLNDGTGDFIFSYTFGTANGYSNPMVLGDIDTDGDLDLITGGDRTYVYLNDGTGQFIYIDYLQGTGGLSGDIALVDIDHDKDLDLITTGTTWWSNLNKYYINILEKQGNRRYTVYATRIGLIGETTANGHVIQSHDHFVALPSRKGLCQNDAEYGHNYEVRITYNGKTVVAPVWDVGPWNTKDDYWNPSSDREMWQDLPQGMPEAQSAYKEGYNNGFDETNNLIETSMNTFEFDIGNQVRPTIDGLNVRSTAGGDKIGSLSKNDIGTVTDGPQRASYEGLDYRWWRIEWGNGLHGWSASKRYVPSPAGIDLADGTFWDDLGMTDNDWVTVEFLWTTGNQIPTCSDGEKNGDETDIDCGGSCPPCDDGESCKVDDDCQSGFCVQGTCQSLSTCDSYADLGNINDEFNHIPTGWGEYGEAPQGYPPPSSGDNTKRYQNIREENTVTLCIEQTNVPYLLTTEVEDGFCKDNFDIYVNGHGPVYSYIGKNNDTITAEIHRIAIPSEYLTGSSESISFKNTATDDCGKAATYNVKLTPFSTLPSSQADFVVGDTVEVYETGGTLAIRKTPGTIDKPEGDVLKRVGDGTILKVIGGPQFLEDNAPHNYWWEVEEIGDDGTKGWSAENGLQKIYRPLISPLEITPLKDVYHVGDELIAKFTITNRGTEPVTFDELVVGGRNPAGDVVDFERAYYITLNRGESYDYQGNLILPHKPGIYHFFIAYRTTDGNWVLDIDVEINGQIVPALDAVRFRTREILVVWEEYTDPPTTALWEEVIGPWEGWGKRLSKIAVHPNNPLVIYVVVKHNTLWGRYEGDKLYRSINGGSTWTEINEGLPRPFLSEYLYPISAIAIAPSNSNILYIGTSGFHPDAPAPSSGKGVYKSTNGGLEWTAVGGPKTSGIMFDYFDISSLVVHPTNPEIFYVGTFREGIWITTTGGGKGFLDWMAVRTSLGDACRKVNALTISPVNPDIIYAAAYNFDPLGPLSEVPPICLLVDNYFIKYEENSDIDTWQELFVDEFVTISGIILDNKKPDIVYVVTERFNVYRSVDGGENWIDASGTVGENPLPSVSRGAIITERARTSIVLHPDLSDVIYVGRPRVIGVDESGLMLTASSVYFSPDAGRNWFATELQEDIEELVFSIDGDYRILYAVGRDGLFKIDLSNGAMAIQLHSPGDLRVYDSQGRITGLVNAIVMEEIPNSFYDQDSKTVVIFNSTNFYRYEVAGTDNGTYGLTIISVEDGETTTFNATNIPTSPNVTHQYTINWTLLAQGARAATIQIDSNGDGAFEQTVTAGSAFHIDKTNLTYTGAPSARYSDPAHPTATLTTENGDPVSNKTITFTLGSQTINATTDENGTATATLILNQIPDNYTIITTFAGDDYYLASSDSDPFEIIKENTNLQAPNGEIIYSDNITIQVTLRDDDSQTLFHQEDMPKAVYLEYFNGSDWIIISEDILNSTDDHDDIMDFYIEIPSDLDEAAGNYQMRAGFGGDDYYNPAISDNGALTILKENTRLSDPSATIVYSDSATVTVTMRDNDDEEILHQPDEPKTIELRYFNGTRWKTITYTNLSEGKATFDFTMPGYLDEPAGDYLLWVRFNGDNRYKPSKAEGTLTILKENVIITVPDKAGFTYDNMTLEAYIKDDEGSNLLNNPHTLDFKIDDKFVGTAIIDQNGHANISWNVDIIPKDTTEIHPIIVNFRGNEHYEEKEAKAEFTLKSPNFLKNEVVSGLYAIRTDNKHSMNDIILATQALTESLDPSLWVDSSHLNPQQGHKVFDKEKYAVKQLLKIIDDKGEHSDPVIKDAIETVIDGITKADELLSRVAITDAINTPVSDQKKQDKIDKEIEKAEQELAKAYQDIADNKPDNAIDHFRNAWKYASSVHNYK